MLMMFNVEYPVEGKIFVVRRALNMHVMFDDLKDYRDNILHSRCHFQNKVCSLIINGDSCTNVANTELVEELNLHTAKHLIPYKLYCLNDSGEVKVNK
jgi:hypothetical protein